MKKVIAGTCLFMILLVGCGGKNNNQVSNEERNANIPEVIKNSYTQIDNNIYDISKLFAVENNNIIRYKVFFDAGMIVIENKTVVMRYIRLILKGLNLVRKMCVKLEE